jgi:hypothetical protein
MKMKVITICAMAVMLTSLAYADEWEHQSMAWVLGPDSTSIRSPYGESQSTGFSWSIVPGNTSAVYYPGGNVIADRVTQDIMDLTAVGLDSFEDYRSALESVLDVWADISGIQNLGYVEETGDVLVGGVEDIVSRGPSAGVGHIRFMAYDSSVISTNVFASATYIPEPGVATDLATNRAQAGDVRFRSDADIWSQGSDDGFYFRKIAMHEVGHVLGFGHNSVSDSVMGGGLYYELGLGEGDIEGAVAIYGMAEVPEPATMTLLGIGGLSLLCRRKRKRLAQRA